MYLGKGPDMCRFVLKRLKIKHYHTHMKYFPEERKTHMCVCAVYVVSTARLFVPKIRIPHLSLSFRFVLSP